MITDFSGMSQEIVLMNYDEIMEQKQNGVRKGLLDIEHLFLENEIIINNDKTKYKRFLKVAEGHCKIYNELLSRYGRTPENKSLAVIDSEISKLKDDIKKLSNDLNLDIQSTNDIFAVFKFTCGDCGFSVTATLLGAPHKCGDCGSKKFLFKKMLFDGKGNEIKNGVKAPFNPDTNPFRNKTEKATEKTGADIKEIMPKSKKTLSVVDSAIKKFQDEIRQSNSSQKLNQSGGKTMVEGKKYKIQCSNPRCNFQYESDSPSNECNFRCKICNFVNDKKELK